MLFAMRFVEAIHMGRSDLIGQKKDFGEKFRAENLYELWANVRTLYRTYDNHLLVANACISNSRFVCPL